MIDVSMQLDRAEYVLEREGKMAGTAYQGEKENFYQGFEDYKKTLKTKNTTHKVEDLLYEMKMGKDKLPWED